MTVLDVVHESDVFVVINKPGGLLAVPGRGSDGQDCVVSRLRSRYPACPEQPAAHRLDMDTSGLMVLALTAAAQRHLAMQFEQRRVSKSYFAILEGAVTADEGEIALAFRLDPENRPRQIYDPQQGKLGLTRWRRLHRIGRQTLVVFRPSTGRTHQLRVHAAHALGLGCPIVGDRLYGTGTRPGQLMLHAAALAFDHPGTGERVRFSSRPVVGKKEGEWPPAFAPYLVEIPDPQAP